MGAKFGEVILTVPIGMSVLEKLDDVLPFEVFHESLYGFTISDVEVNEVNFDFVSSKTLVELKVSYMY